MTRPRRPRGLRGRIALTFGAGALLISAALALSTFLIARDYLVDQREGSALRQAYLDASFVHARLETSGADVAEALAASDPPESGSLIITRGGEWFSSSLGVGSEAIPADLQQRVEAGQPARVRTRVNDAPAIVVGLPLPDVDAAFYRIASLDELDDTLRTLGTVLTGGAALAAGGGIAVGVWASRRTVQPLNLVAAAAAEIAGGRLDTRLAATDDPDLTTIVGSFNSMVDSLQQRLERDARFAADVSHELRSPMTTLVASVEVLQRRRDELPARAQHAVDLVAGDLARFQRMLDNLLYLARAEAGLDVMSQEPVSLPDLLGHTLARLGQPARLLRADGAAYVRGDKAMLDRAFANLIDNADRHGGGLTAITVQRDGDNVLTLVDDAGPGVPVSERERVFERFATGGAARGSSSGTGLGLALAAEAFAAHDGAIWCTDRMGGGARFVVRLPAVETL